MQNNIFLKIINKYYPHILTNKIIFLDDGWDHYVYVIDGKTAFRFPRTDEHGKKDKIETKFLKIFSPTSPIKVQEMKRFKDTETGISYQVYEFIQGIRLTRDLANTFSQEELSGIAKRLGVFLTVLHSFPLEEARKIYMDEIDPRDYIDFWADFLKEIQLKMYHYFSKLEHGWIENIFNEFNTGTVSKLAPISQCYACTIVPNSV